MKKCIVVSGVNFFEGGPLSVMRDCLLNLDQSFASRDIRILALVSERALYDDLQLKHVELHEFPRARRRYWNRIYLEYFHFKGFARRNHVTFWLSMHDMTPSLDSVAQAVYCHNPAPFYNISWGGFRMDPTFGLTTFFYKYFYAINIRRNRYVIVQQNWLREIFAADFRLNKSNVIVSHPHVSAKRIGEKVASGKIVFAYPAFPRVFKNLEVIGEAVSLLEKRGINAFEVHITIDGSENKYARLIKEKYGHLPALRFRGLLPREQVYNLYAMTDALIFPSCLETWGLPISEFKQTHRTIFAADLPYAHETVGTYDKVIFFDPRSGSALADMMEAFIKRGPAVATSVTVAPPAAPFAENWDELFHILLP